MGREVFLRLSVVVLLALIYFAAAKLGLSLAFVNASATAVWPPTGIAIAALLLLGYRVWPGIFLGALVANLTTSGSEPASLMIAIGNTLEGLCAAYLINRFAHGRQTFNRLADILKFILLAAIVSSTVSATIGVTSLVLNGLAAPEDISRIWSTWWAGDATGALIFTPPLVLWALNPRVVGWSRVRALEVTLLSVVGIAICLMVFAGFSSLSVLNYPVQFPLIPVIMWFAFRFDARTVATAALVVSATAIWGTVHGFGPYGLFAPGEALMLVQGFTSVVAMTGLCLAVVVSERRRAEREYRESGERHRVVAETATDAIVTIDKHSTITYINAAGEKIFGYPVADMLGKSLTMLMPDYLRNVHKSSFHRYLTTGKKHTAWNSLELPGLHKEGHEIPLEISFGEFHQNGKHFFTGIVRDVTQRKQAEESQRWLATIVASSDDAIIGETLDGVILSWNQAAEQTYGYTAEEAVGSPVTLLAPPDRQQEPIEFLQRIRRGETVQNFETKRVCKDGTVIDVSLTVSPMKSPTGIIIGASTIARDISAQKRWERALKVSETRYRRLFESAKDGIFLLNQESGKVVDVNSSLVAMLGHPSSEFLGKPIWEAGPLRNIIASAAVFRELCTAEFFRFDHVALEDKDGHRIDVEFISNAYPVDETLSAESKLIQCNIRDITERRRAEERIRHMAQHDVLTGLPNRMLFKDRVTHAISQAHRNRKQVAVLFVDLDHFKDTNDSLGHDVGDRLLRAIARRLQSCLREDDSVARLGGDEFVMCLAELSGSNDAILIADKILDALRRPLMVDQHELHVGGSIGISLYPDNGDDAEALMRTADTAMYHAKEKGRDNYQFFVPRLNEAAQRRLTIANHLHRAMDRNEFVLHYQPQLDLKSGQIFSAEALIRWQQSDIGLVPPGEFIKVAEETGLIVPLGEWVLRQACEQLKRWRSMGYPNLRITVNLSPHQLRRPGFSELAARVLQETGLPPDALEMELTESILMMYSAENITALGRLARMGVRLAVDDFGTGYSSLAYLQRFPIDVLKIDQSFVSGIGQDPNDTAIVSAIIAMADSLQLKVVAEGVETSDQVDFLRTRGCFAAQGFYYSKAVSARVFSDLLDRQLAAAPSA